MSSSSNQEHNICVSSANAEEMLYNSICELLLNSGITNTYNLSEDNKLKLISFAANNTIGFLNAYSTDEVISSYEVDLINYQKQLEDNHNIDEIDAAVNAEIEATLNADIEAILNADMEEIDLNDFDSTHIADPAPAMVEAAFISAPIAVVTGPVYCTHRASINKLCPDRAGCKKSGCQEKHGNCTNRKACTNMMCHFNH
jgi:hypothetical protein